MLTSLRFEYYIKPTNYYLLHSPEFIPFSLTHLFISRAIRKISVQIQIHICDFKFKEAMEIVESIRRITQPNAPLMQPSQLYQREVDGKASAFLLEIKPGAMAYRYDVNIVVKWNDPNTNRDFEKNLAKGTDEGMRSRNRSLCYDLLSVSFMQTDFLPDGEIVYDCKSTLYTSKPILGSALNRKITFPASEATDYVKTYCAPTSQIEVEIGANASGHELTLDNFEQYTTRETINQEDRSIRTFLEMAVAQHGLNENLYTPIGAGNLFDLGVLRTVDNGMILRSGISKGVRIVKGNMGKPIPALVVDVKVSPFFAPQNLIDTVRAISHNRLPNTDRAWDEIATLLQDVRVEVNYNRDRTFSIQRLTRQSANEIQVQHNGQMMSLVEYFRQSRDYQIQNPQLRVVIPHYAQKEDKGNSTDPEHYFPIEMLVIMPDQRVPLEKMSQNLSQQLLMANSLTPEVRYTEMMKHCERLDLFTNKNPVLKAFGISINRDSNDCKINVRPSPQIEFRDQRPLNVNRAKAEWKIESTGKRYYTVEQISNWVILCHKDHERQVGDFANKFMVAAGERGMNFADRPRIQTLVPDASNWKQIFDDFAAKDVQFVIYVDSVKMDTHGILKYYEVRNKILTQHITIERVMDVLGHPRGRQTLQNILNKTNMKYSGVNYHPVFERALVRFRLEDNNVLVVGYDVATPPPMHVQERRMCQAINQDLLSFDPSVIGISANMAADPHNFVGDYYYQETYRMGMDYDKLTQKFKWVLDMVANFRSKNPKPQYIFVIRNGLSEGQFAQLVQREMESLRKGCALYSEDYHPKFVYILGTKRHSKKYYALERDNIRNMDPGSVVDDKFVREDCPEFFMQSHFALKGVGKPVEYNVLLDEIGCTKDEVEGFLNSLCYTHQIVNSAISMPEPVYQADELAKRGRNNYITMKRLDEQLVPRRGEHNFVDTNALNDMLTYRDNPIFIGTRFTA